MLIKFWNWFTKLTAWPIQWLLFRTKIYYEDPSKQKRHIKGPAVIISNHTSVFDYVVWLFVFYTRTVRFQMAELLFKKKVLGVMLRMLGGIYVDRDAKNFGFVTESLDILENGGVVGIFPESRIPLKHEKTPLEFKTSAAYIALTSGVPVIPVYTNGSYFNRKRAAAIIGKPLFASELTKQGLTDKENINEVSVQLRNRIIELEKLFNEKHKAS